jgi:hypothetical protein
MFKRALGLGVREAATDGALDEIMAFCAGVEGCVALAPQAKPPELTSWLERRGFVSGYGWTKFSRDAGDPPQARTELRVERVDDGTVFADTAVRGYGQGAILATRIEAAAATGCALVVTETGEPRDGQPGASYRNILRAGFEPQYVRPNYLSSPQADTSGTTA